MPIDMKVFIKNRSEIPPESLVKYGGQWVAWSQDGTHIVAASAESEEDLSPAGAGRPCRLGTMVGYVPDPNEGAFFGLLPEAAFFEEGDAPRKE